MRNTRIIFDMNGRPLWVPVPQIPTGAHVRDLDAYKARDYARVEITALDLEWFRKPLTKEF